MMVERAHVLDAFVLEKMAETRLPGLSLSLVQHGEVRYARGFGFRDLERGIPATPSTAYAIGSLTKSFTCLALMQLQEQGKLNIDDPVTKYLPLTVTPAGQPVRLWHLMTHTSGIPALAYAEAAIRQRVGAGDTWVPIATAADMLTFVNGAEAWVHCDPGTRWFYLNEGYVLLGAVIETVTGRPYAEYVREAILAPLGMRRTWFEQSQVVADSDVAVPYLLPKDKPQIPSRYAFGQITSDGGLFSSMDDLVRYASMYLANGRGPSGPIVRPQSIEAMVQPRVPLPGLRERGGSWEPAGHYGYGLSIYPDFLGHTMVGHGGSVLVSTAYMGLIPALGIGVVLAANGSGYPLQHVAACALAVAIGRDPWEIPALRLDRCLGALTGIYETYRGTFRAVVRRAGDFLALEVRLGEVEQIIPLVPESPSAMDVDTPRFFTLTGGHRMPVEFSVRGPDVELVYERYKFRRVGKI